MSFLYDVRVLVLCVLGLGTTGLWADLSGENVCLKRMKVEKAMNVSYVRMVRGMNSYFCMKSLKFFCLEEVNKLVKEYKLENVTRILNVKECCEGYRENGEGGCEASCEKTPCFRGNCVSPEVCSCFSGYSGEDCSIVSCEDPRKWGPGCVEDCACTPQRGVCDPQTGRCTCHPGYQGPECTRTCSRSEYGPNCGSKCTCKPGTLCHHVTGNCFPCESGRYGQDCAGECACNEEGTSLCHPVTGKCYCKPRYYGASCDQYCPFGYNQDQCLKEPLANVTCSCPDDTVYKCDPLQGCVCKVEGECGEELMDAEYLSSLVSYVPPKFSQNENSAINSAVVSTSFLLILLLLITTAVAAYYYRRYKRVNEDLHNRVVFYSNTHEGPMAQPNEYQLVVSDSNSKNMKPNNLTPCVVNVFPKKDTNVSANIYEEIIHSSKENNIIKESNLYEKSSKFKNKD